MSSHQDHKSPQRFVSLDAPHRTLRDSGESVSLVPAEGVLQGVGGESVEGNLRPDVFFKASDDGSIHPEDRENSF